MFFFLSQEIVKFSLNSDIAWTFLETKLTIHSEKKIFENFAKGWYQI